MSESRIVNAPEATTSTRRFALASRNLVGLRTISPNRIGAVYVLLAVIVVFSVWIPSNFLRVGTIQLILNSNSITALAGLALIVPLSARVFDLSFAYTMTLAGVTTSHFLVTSSVGLTGAIFLGLGAALIVGILNGIVVVVMKIDSFIGTLATGSLVSAFITYVTGGATVNGSQLSGTFSELYSVSWGGITLPVFYAIALALVLWVGLEYTATGRRLYAVGFNTEAARLANIRIARLRFGSLLVSAIVSGFAGIVLAAQDAAGSTTAGTPYLLLAYATVFVGATQFKNGRFNAWGTLVAVLMLGTGVTGLGLAAAPSWAPDMFTGVVLIGALGATALQRRRLRGGGSSGLLSRISTKGKGSGSVTAAAPDRSGANSRP
jgi:ribose transport system permease protein